MIRHLALTVSDVCLKLSCFQSTSTYSALEVSHFVCCINSRLTNILTYWLTGLILLVITAGRCDNFYGEEEPVWLTPYLRDPQPEGQRDYDNFDSLRTVISGLRR